MLTAAEDHGRTVRFRYKLSGFDAKHGIAFAGGARLHPRYCTS
jgi:hypothetical protein